MEKPINYIYPAVLTYEEGYEIAVTFPDLPGCTSSGATDKEAIAMGKEALGLHLWSMEQDGDRIPEPSAVCSIELDENEVVTLIEVYMPSVRERQNNKAVNRTVTLPAWLNAAAQERNINFSQVLQDALKAQISAQ